MPTHTKPWFIVREVLHNLWSISEQGWDTAYLAVGTDGALLVDTCWGIGDLRAVVESITRLPVTLVHTHGHADHVSGSAQFETVHISGDDRELLESCYTKRFRTRWAENFHKLLLEQGRSPRAWSKTRLGRVVPITNGHAFYIGGRTFRAISVPGHTAGCICLFEPREGILITGDSVLEGDIFLHTPDSVGLGAYLFGLRKLCASARSVRYILPGHNRTPIDPSILGILIEGVKDILKGNRKDPVFKDGGLNARFGRASVIYRPS
jgi:hydroxyacylglutathione hydrolase